ncbi:MAG TPA: glycosyltransferase family 39 protein [Polyangiales bacterium]|nr:glycosyltransferase family 39 protein [Polyangiales bacterium]
MTRRSLRIAGWALGCALAVAGFYDARQLNSGFRLPMSGPWSVPESEQVFYLWYLTLGSFAVWCLARLLSELDLAPRLSRAVTAVAAKPGTWLAAMALFTFGASLGFRHAVLIDEPVTDDEGTYRFIARTLLQGRVTNPVPADAEFFANQFIVINAHGWHGKYPIGHPLVLALGEAIGAIDLMMPLCGALCVWLTWRVGRHLFEQRVALIGASLLVLSPHFVWTCGTLLSQPTLCLALLAGLLCVLRAEQAAHWRWPLLAGAVFGWAVLVRPLPGGLFGGVAALQLAFGDKRIAKLALFGAGAAPSLALFLAVNYLQSGSMFTSGYQSYHSDLKLAINGKGEIVNSLVGALIRENFWLLGWTCTLPLLAWCQPRRRWLYWGMLGSELVYRVIAPKTVVSTTGPIYLTEIVPLLVLGVTDALARLGRALPELRVRPSVVALSATLIGACMFVPLPLWAAGTGAATRHVIHDELAKAKADKALIFCNSAVYPDAAVTWAYFPDNPSPTLDDDYIFVRVPESEDRREKMFAFWKKTFPERRAFVYAWHKKGYIFNELTSP